MSMTITEAVALALSIAAFVQSVCAVCGLVYCIGEIRGWARTKYSVIYPHEQPADLMPPPQSPRVDGLNDEFAKHIPPEVDGVDWNDV